MINIINMRNVSVRYGNKFILRNINLDISKGSFVSVVGLNGSGKSFFIKTLAGLYESDGYININGYVLDDININNIRKDISVVLDDIDTQFMGETVFDDLIFNMDNLRYSRDEIDKMVEYISELFGIKGILNNDVRFISNSDRQKLAIAASLTTNPSVLLLDDCFQQLSVKDRKEIFDILRKYRKDKKITIIMSSNNMDDVINSDRVIVLNNGSVIRDDNVIQVFKDRKLMNTNGLKIPFVIDLSLRLMDKGVINHIYLDVRKLVKDLWK